MKNKMILAACCLTCIVGYVAAQQGKGSYASASLHAGSASLGYSVKGMDGVEGTTSNKTGSLLAGPAGSYHPDANDNIGKGIIYNGLFNSNLTDKITPLSFGLKVGLRFKL